MWLVHLAQLEKLGEGREAEVFAQADGRALRLFRDGFARDVEHERLAIAAARAGHIPAPLLHELLSMAGREGVVLDRVDGETQLELVGRKPWILLREARRTGRLHARLHAIAAPERLQSLQERVRERIGRAGAPERLATTALKAMAELPSASQLCHGDYHPGNLLVEASGRHFVIDWGGASAGPPEADVARTIVLLRLGDPDNPSPAIRLITRYARRLLIAGYLRGYHSVTKIRRVPPLAMGRRARRRPPRGPRRGPDSRHGSADRGGPGAGRPLERQGELDRDTLVMTKGMRSGGRGRYAAGGGAHRASPACSRRGT